MTSGSDFYLGLALTICLIVVHIIIFLINDYNHKKYANRISRIGPKFMSKAKYPKLSFGFKDDSFVLYQIFCAIEGIFFFYCICYPESLDLCFGVTCSFFLRSNFSNMLYINLLIIGLGLYLVGDPDGKKVQTDVGFGTTVALFFFLCYKAWGYFTSYILNIFAMLIELGIIGTLGSHSSRIFGIVGVGVGSGIVFGLWTLSYTIKIKLFIDSYSKNKRV